MLVLKVFCNILDLEGYFYKSIFFGNDIKEEISELKVLIVPHLKLLAYYVTI